MRSVFLKSLTVAAVSYLTWFSASLVVAQYAKKSPAKPAETKMGMWFVEGDQLPPKGATGRGPLASGSISKIDVTVKDGVATVSAVASLTDRRPGMNYIWDLKVATTGRQTLARQVYHHQIFSVPETGALRPTFLDTIVVPPGESIVELSLYAFARGTDMRFLDDEGVAKGYSSAKVWRKVVN